MKSKYDSILKHFKKRMAERHQLILTQGDINEIITLIKSNNSKLIEKQSNRVIVYEIRYKNKTFHIPFDTIRKIPITVYKDEWLI
jgi:hypothetical protein